MSVLLCYWGHCGGQTHSPMEYTRRYALFDVGGGGNENVSKHVLDTKLNLGKCVIFATFKKRKFNNMRNHRTCPWFRGPAAAAKVSANTFSEADWRLGPPKMKF